MWSGASIGALFGEVAGHFLVKMTAAFFTTAACFEKGALRVRYSHRVHGKTECMESHSKDALLQLAKILLPSYVAYPVSSTGNSTRAKTRRPCSGDCARTKFPLLQRQTLAPQVTVIVVATVGCTPLIDCCCLSRCLHTVRAIALRNLLAVTKRGQGAHELES